MDSIKRVFLKWTSALSENQTIFMVDQEVFKVRPVSISISKLLGKKTIEDRLMVVKFKAETSFTHHRKI